MDLSKIVAISGKPGLYKIVGDIRNGLLVESLDNNKRLPVHGTQKVSALQDISIFCQEDDLPLPDVLEKIFDHMEGKSGPDYKSDPAELKKFFEESLPEYDRERVYNSDIKKVVRWYNDLLSKGLLVKEEKEKEEDTKEKKENGKDNKKTADASADISSAETGDTNATETAEEEKQNEKE